MRPPPRLPARFFRRRRLGSAFVALVGYIYLASAKEDFASRRDALKSAGCTEIIQEYPNTGWHSRPKLAKLLARLRPADTLIVTDLAHVAWSLPEVIALLASLRDRGIVFRALESPIRSHTVFRALEAPIDTSGPNAALIQEALQAILALNKAMDSDHRYTQNSVSAAKRTKVMEAAAKLLARRPGMSYSKLGAELKRLGHKPPRGGSEWSLSSVMRLLNQARLNGILIDK